jgi:hypothetical protein
MPEADDISPRLVGLPAGERRRSAMPESEYKPVAHDHDAFLKKAFERTGFAEATRVSKMSTSWCENCWPLGSSAARWRSNASPLVEAEEPV